MGARIPALLAVLQRADADIIALQEVAPWFSRVLENTPWLQSYVPSRLHGRTAYPGGQHILSRWPIRDSRARVLPGRQRRTVLISDVVLDGEVLQVVTTHMESFLEDGPTRAEQLDAIFALLDKSTDAIVLGDFNFGDGEAEEARIPSDFTDAWVALRQNEPGFTWDIERSEMARDGSFPGEPSRRLDRILLRSSHWRAASVRIVGNQPVQSTRPDLFPSDHFGVTAKLVRGPG
jgi:tyrosyl-DNA phosphodiesterase 2